jgi:translation initiation factor IF-1
MGKRNTTGGSAHKGLARKFINSNQRSNDVLRLPENHGEQFAVVSKMLGDGKCRVNVSLDDGSIVELLCHIRGKFRGRNKKHNIVAVSSLLLVGLRDWESNLSNCDLIHIFDPSSFSSFPSHLSLIISNLSNNNNNNNPNLDLIDFSNPSLPSYPSNPSTPSNPLHNSESESDLDLDFLLI